MKSGVPRGDAVSPALFNILINNFLRDVDRYPGRTTQPASCYADDVLIMAQSRATLPVILQVAKKWAENNRMSRNVGKSIELKSQEAPQNHPLLLACLNMLESPRVTYLGLQVKWDGLSHNATLERIKTATYRLCCLARSPKLRTL